MHEGVNMKAGSKFINILKNGCVFFTVITLFTYCIGAILSNAERSFIPTLQWILLFFVFSLLLSGAAQIMHLDKIAVSVRYLLHFLTSAALYTVVVVLCGGFYKNGTMLLLSILLFIVGYIIFVVLYSIQNRKHSGKAKKKEDYKSVFH